MTTTSDEQSLAHITSNLQECSMWFTHIIPEVFESIERLWAHVPVQVDHCTRGRHQQSLARSADTLHNNNSSNRVKTG
jgi:hypothetical protein